MFKEGNHGGSHRVRLVGCNVYKVDLSLPNHARLSFGAHFNLIVNEPHVLVIGDAGVGNVVLFFVQGVEVDDLVGHYALLHSAVGSLYDTKVVNARICGKAQDKPDVRTLRRMDRTEAPIVAGMHVADLKAGAFASESAGTHGREGTQMLNLGKHVVLPHEL